MERKLRALFDFQRYQPSPRLEKLIRETEERQCKELSEEDLLQVAAAGEPGFLQDDKDETI